MRNIVLSLCVICLLISCTKEQIDYSKDINNLQSQITALQRRQDSLANALSATNDIKIQLAALQKRSDSLVTALSTTNTSVSSLSIKLDSLKVQINSITAQINTYNTQISTLSSQLALANANIVSANVTIDSLKSQVIVLTQQLSALQIQVNSILIQLNTSISSGLVAYYPFNGNANDSTSYANNGVVNGLVALNTDRFGKASSAYVFAGGTISVPHKSYLSIQQNGQFSVSVWVLKTGSQNPVHIIGKRASGETDFNWQLAQHINPSGLPGGGLVFTGVDSVATGINYTGVADSTIKLNKWEHLVGTYNNGTWSLYKNGVLVAKKVSTIYAADTGNPALEIGNCGGWGAFHGRIDDVRIYSRELNLNEINTLYQLPY